MNKLGRAFSLSSACLILAASSVSAQPKGVSPEEDTKRVASGLRPVADDVWAQIMASRPGDTYEIVKGDTLYDISKKLFGDSRYWPKIWSLNNDTITNPHYIRPGNKIQFLPGGGGTLPTLALSTEESTTTGTSSPTVAGTEPSGTESSGGSKDKVVTRRAASQEWKQVPPEKWNGLQAQLPPQVDPLGFDSRSKISFNTNMGFELQAFAESDEIEPWGTITGGRVVNKNFFTGDVVFIDPDQELQVGDTYAIVPEKPFSLSTGITGRRVLVYPIVGSVRVAGVKDNLFVGVMEHVAGYVTRGTKLIPKPARVSNINLIPGPSPVEGTMHISKELLSADFTAQHKYVFVDRGTDEGVQPGMVFRIYQKRDPSNDKSITDTDFLIDADLLVVQSSFRVSTAIVFRSFREVRDQAPAVLLTDVADLVKKRIVREKKTFEDIEVKGRNELDALEKDDEVGGGIGRKEKKELRQLERWEKSGELNPDLDSVLDEPSPEAALPAPIQTPVPAEEPLPATEEPVKPKQDDEFDALLPEEAPPAPSDVPPVEAAPEPIDSGAPTESAETQSDAPSTSEPPANVDEELDAP